MKREIQQAYDHHRAHPDTPVHSELFFRQHVKFQYPISSLLILAPFEIACPDAKTIYQSLGVLLKLSLAILLGACSMLGMSLLEGDPDTVEGRRLVHVGPQSCRP